MRSRISSSRATALKKDFSRFAPVWILYTVAGLLFFIPLLLLVDDAKAAASMLAGSLPVFVWINLFYAAICAQVLFSDLFTPRLCNALHTLPLRRSQWFWIHAFAGLCFSLIPHLIWSAILLPILWGSYAVYIPLWLLGVTLEFIFFFCAGVFSCMCAGNRLAATAVYGLINFFPIIALWFTESLLIPMLPGVVVDSPMFYRLCPPVALTENYLTTVDYSTVLKDPFAGIHADAGMVAAAILAGIGILLLLVSLRLYHHRHLERAGDFVAVKPLSPIFTVICSLACGTVCYFFSCLLFDRLVQFVFLFSGVIIGFLISRMLVLRRVKVFTKKTFLGLGATLAALGAALLLTWLDPMGITTWLPDAEDVQQVQFINDSNYMGTPEATFTSQEHIAAIIEAHQMILDMGEEKKQNWDVSVKLRYVLKSGVSVTRRYRIPQDLTAFAALNKLLSTPEAIFGCGYDQWDTLLDRITHIGYEYESQIKPEYEAELMTILRRDMEEGRIAQYWDFRSDKDQWHALQIHVQTKYSSDVQVFSILVTDGDLSQWLEENKETILKN